MAKWIVRNHYKKTVIEYEHYTKDGMEIIRETGWRLASWDVTTTDDQMPELSFDDGVNMSTLEGSNIESVDLIETFDGCWEDIEWPTELDNSEQERLQSIIEEEGFYAIEDQGWTQSDAGTWIRGPVEICTPDEEVVRIVTCDEDGNIIDFEE